jgi:hemerythrin
MQFVFWSDQFSVGVQSLDDQHAILLDAINDLHEAMMKGQRRKVVGGLLRTLLKYTRSHFADEERLMEWTGFPELDSHKQAHHDLLEQVEEYLALYANGEPSQSSWIVGFYSTWLQAHILEADRAYGHWIEQQFPPVSFAATTAFPRAAAIH